MGLKRKRNVNVVFKAAEGSEENQSAAGEYLSFTGGTGGTGQPCCISLGPAACPECGV